MGMVPSYKDNEWQVLERRPVATESGPSGTSLIQIRVLEGGEWRDYWVPQDSANSDYAQYLEWVAEGNSPRIVF